MIPFGITFPQINLLGVLLTPRRRSHAGGVSLFTKETWQRDFFTTDFFPLMGIPSHFLDNSMLYECDFSVWWFMYDFFCFLAGRQCIPYLLRWEVATPMHVIYAHAESIYASKMFPVLKIFLFLLSFNPFLFIKNKRLLISSEGFSTL